MKLKNKGFIGFRKFLERRNVLKNQKGRRFYLVVVTHRSSFFL